jgi:hypothetical protein
MTLSPDSKKVTLIDDRTKLPKPLSEVALKQFVKKAVAKDWVKEGWHSEVERANRNVSHDDILCGLGRPDWTLTNTRECPKYNDSPHTYEILTKDADEVELELVVAPNLKTGTIKVVTKY